MKRLLILPILSLIGAAAFCSGIFSTADDTPLQSDLAPTAETPAVTVGNTEEYLFNQTTESTPIASEKAPLSTEPEVPSDEPVLDPTLDLLDPEVEINRFTQGGFLTGAIHTPEVEETEAPVVTTTAPVTTTTKAPETTKKPETTKAPTTTTKAPETTQKPVVSTPNNGKITAQQQKIVDIAIGEIGVKETGTNNVKYNTWFFGYPVSGRSNAWCGTFVLWCARHAGVTEDVFPTIRSTVSLQSWFKSNGTYTAYSSSYTPKIGDVIFIDWAGRRGSVDHVGLVVSVENGIVTTVEGNYSDQVSCNTYAINSKYIAGYASPNYR